MSSDDSQLLLTQKKSKILLLKHFVLSKPKNSKHELFKVMYQIH